MAYQIDFTASNYANRSRRKIFLRLLLLATLGGVAWGVYDVWKIYNEPTLNMRLASYEAVARPIEEINAAWDKTAKEYNAVMRYYRLVGAANPTNFLDAVSAVDAPRPGRGIYPRTWTLTTGGECTFDYRYVFHAGDKAEQAKSLEADVVQAITSLVSVVGGKVDLQGVQVENLLNVDELNLKAKFTLPNVVSVLSKKGTLSGSVSEIAAMRKKVQDAKIVENGDVKRLASTAKDIMMTYLPGQFGKDKETGNVDPNFPGMTNVLNVAGWFDRADQFIQKKRIPGNEAERRQLKEIWNGIGNARLPWQRFRVLDNEELVQRTKTLGEVADGVKPFKAVLERYHAVCAEKLESFIEAYDHRDVFNKPLVESDLKDRVAKAVGISQASVTFKDLKEGEPVVLVKSDETFTFSWVHWTLTIGAAMGREAERDQQPIGESEGEPLTLEKVAACTRTALTLGPGYVLNSVKINFATDGTVSGAILEGLLPVKKVESKKETTKNVD